MSLRDQLQVLVVDDMSTSRGLLTQALDQLGIRNYSTEADGQSAWQRLATKRVHLVISDFNMPRMNGLQLLEAIRKQKQIAQTGFILVTGRVDAELIQTGVRLGMNNYLKKPFSPEQLKTCIEKVVGRF